MTLHNTLLRYTFLLVSILLLPNLYAQENDTILVHFGTQPSLQPWNNLGDFTDGSIASLTNKRGNLTGYGIEVSDAFSGVNTAGTQEPSTSPQLPSSASGDSFYGNDVDFGGQNEPTGGIRLTHLKPDKEYTLSIFASRTATDNREAIYIITGSSVDTVYLDAASNTDKIVTVTAFPTADSTITVVAGPGPNNDNGNGFYYLGALVVSYEAEESTPPPPPPSNDALDTVLVDFGGSNTSPRPWNNITDPREGAIDDLTNSGGFQTGYGLSIVDDFNGVNTNGTVNPDPSLGLTPQASGDSFFGNVSPFGGQTQPTAGVMLTGLTPDKSYTVELFGSRTATDNRETQYIVEGLIIDTVYLDVASNSTEAATTTLRPAADGSLLISIAPGPNNANSSKFYYLGALRLLYDNEVPAGGTQLTLLRPDGGERYQTGKTTSIVWQSRNLQEVAIEYSTDNGATYTTIDTVPAFDEAYEWTVPATSTTEGRIRLSSDTLVSVSSGVFTIASDSTTCTIVVLGSSTAEGTGASTPDSAWVARYTNSLASDTRYEVVNLGRGGYTTYHILPTGTTPPQGVTISPDPDRNITQALSLDPFAIIVNMPSNDAANNFPAADQLANFATVAEAAREQGVMVYIATTQPRNFTDDSQIELQREVRDSILAVYGENALDFWDGLAAENGFIYDSLDSGDGVHLNDAGHRILFERVRELRLDTMSCDTSTTATSPRPLPLRGVRVYPNPASGGVLYVELPPGTQGGRVEVQLIDLLGRAVYHNRDAALPETGERIRIAPSRTIGSNQYLFCVVTVHQQGQSRRQAVPILWR